jgi:hypothetical protein
MSRHRSLLAALAAGLLTVLGAAGFVEASNARNASSAGTATASEMSGSAQRQVRQSAKLLMHPQIVQPGSQPKSAASAESSMTAAFRPARAGRPVTLQRRTGSGWVTVAKDKESRGGIVEFAAPYLSKGKVATYRASAAPYKGLSRANTAAVRTSQPGPADFSDEFGGTELNSANWSHRLQGYAPESSRMCSKAGAEAARVEDGAVTLSVLNDPARPSLTDNLDGTEKCRYQGKSYDWRLNGHISTDGKRSFLYGFAAARIKFQPRRGQHGSFWMMPASQAASEGSPKQTGAEIDVIEWFGNAHPDGGLTSFVHYWPDNQKAGTTSTKVGGFVQNTPRFGEDWAAKYHVFSVEWTPQRYIFRIDGKETFRTSKGVSGQPEFLILSLLSSDYELGYLGGEDKLPQSMKVDWVRFWQP